MNELPRAPWQFSRLKASTTINLKSVLINVISNTRKNLKLLYQLLDLVIVYTFLFFLCLPFTNTLALAQNDDFSNPDKTLNENTVSIKKAINYAINNYNIEVTVDKSFIHEKVPGWASEKTPLKQWVRQVFRSFDKIFYYDIEGKLQSIKIIGLKNSVTKRQEKQLTNESKKSDLVNPTQNYSEPPEGVIIPGFSETNPNVSSEVTIPDPAEIVSKTPEGVVINNTLEEDSEPPAGVKFSESPNQESMDIEGEVITNKVEESSKSPDNLK